MMEKKGKYLPVWGRYADMFMEMSNNRAGELIKAMVGYFFMDQEPTLTGEGSIYWSFLKNDLDYARESYESKVRNSRKAGVRSGEVRREKAKTSGGTDMNRNEPKRTVVQKNEQNRTDVNQTEQITETESKKESKPNSRTDTETESPAVPGVEPPAEAVSVSKKESFGKFGWVKLTREEYEALEVQMGSVELQKCIYYVDESAQITGNRNKWKDWYSLIQKCCRERWHEPRYQRREEIPKGASGVLGEAELEAIRNIMAMD